MQHESILYEIERMKWKFTNNSEIKIKLKIDEMGSLSPHCIDCGFEKFETIEKKRTKRFIESLNYVLKFKIILPFCLMCTKYKSKKPRMLKKNKGN